MRSETTHANAVRDHTYQCGPCPHAKCCPRPRIPLRYVGTHSLRSGAMHSTAVLEHATRCRLGPHSPLLFVTRFTIVRYHIFHCFRDHAAHCGLGTIHLTAVRDHVFYCGQDDAVYGGPLQGDHELYRNRLQGVHSTVARDHVLYRSPLTTHPTVVRYNAMLIPLRYKTTHSTAVRYNALIPLP